MPELNTYDYDVAIIGAGFSGAMVAVHLARNAKNLRLLVVDKGGAFGRGVAYSEGPVQHLLNVPAAKMSAFPDEPHDFLNWARARGGEIEGVETSQISTDAFLPRQVYGEYVSDIFEKARVASNTIEIRQTEIIDVEDLGEALVLQDATGRKCTVAKLVLALGNFVPGDPSTRDRDFRRSARYLNSPWDPHTLHHLSGDEDVLILGSGLTGLDLLVSLSKIKHRGTMHVISRRGLFPQPHQKYTPQPDRFHDRELPHTIRGLARLVRREVKAAVGQDINWRAIIDALRPHTQNLWKSLNIEERRRFMRHLRPFWESHRHRVAPPVLAMKDEMVQQGRLTNHRGRVTRIVQTQEGFEVNFVERATQEEKKLGVGFIINCTGPECNYYKLKDPLVVNLLARGLIHPDPLFLGLATAPNGALLNYLGQPSKRIFTIGSPQKGMLFETTAVPELRVQAQRLAEELSRAGETAAASATPSKSDNSLGNIILISNRGPNDFVWEENQWTLRPSSSGQVRMIEPLARQSDVTWFCCVSEPPLAGEAREALFTTSVDQTDPAHHIVPVPLPAHIFQAYYAGISNEVLWTLQHHLVGQVGYSSIDAARHHAWNEGYLEANRRVVVAIRASGIKPRAFLIQDYHFYVLPALLREVFPDVPILHFTHIPFPDAATFKLIPQEWRDAILNGMLSADVLGMQTQWDAHPFFGCCEELLGAKVDYQRGTVTTSDGRTVRVCVFPASIDPIALRQMMRSPAVDAARASLAPYYDRQTIVHVDHLDPSKNQIIGCKAFGRLLELRPDLRGNVRFLAFLVPSRTDLNVYREYHDAVCAAIDEVNQRFKGNCGVEPIQVFYTNSREQALAAMEQCDAFLANSREEGMNLAVKEWALVSKRPGVAIVSETAGVAAELGANSLLISPLDVEGTARAMAWALDMPRIEREARLTQLRSKVNSWTAAHWLSAQLEALDIGSRPNVYPRALKRSETLSPA